MSKVRYLGLSAVFALGIAACGGSPTQEPQSPDPGPTPSATPAEQPAAPSAAPSASPAPTASASSTASAPPELPLPEILKGKAVVLAATDANYARADMKGAVKSPGEGGLSQGMVVRL